MKKLFKACPDWVAMVVLVFAVFWLLTWLAPAKDWQWVTKSGSHDLRVGISLVAGCALYWWLTRNNPE